MNLIACAALVVIVLTHLLFGKRIGRSIELMGGYFWLIFLFLVANCEKLVPLQCYVCNSNYQRCGQSSDFDSTVQYTSPCYGYCVKINVYPGGN